MLCKHSSDAALIHINYARLKSTFKIIHFPTVTNHPMKALMPCWGSYLKLLYKQSYLRRLGGQATTAVSVLYFKNRHQLTPPQSPKFSHPSLLGQKPILHTPRETWLCLKPGPSSSLLCLRGDQGHQEPQDLCRAGSDVTWLIRSLHPYSGGWCDAPRSWPCGYAA